MRSSSDAGTKASAFRNRPGNTAVLAKMRGSGEKGETKEDAKDKEKEKEEEKKKKEEEQRQKEREEKEEREKKEAEKKATEPPKKELPYPEWWKASYPRSSVVSQNGQFVDDRALFPQCPFSGASPSDVKTKGFGYVEPPRYLKNSRNPCWFESNVKKTMIKCLPYFYIVGAPKSGAADLYNRLQGHPYILQGGGPFYSWWDRLRYGASKSPKYTREAKRTPDAAVQFKEYAKDVVGKHGKNLTKEVMYSGESLSIIGDASATYLTDNTQWDVYEGNEGCSEPRIITASFIRHVFPQARLILMLRDPVDRLYSRFLANVPYVYEYENHTSALFHTFVVKAVQAYRECIARLSIRHCAYNTSLYTSSVVRLSEGMYSVFVEDWMRVFPKDQMMIIRFEDYAKDVQGYIHKVFQHLGVDPIDAVSELKLAELPVMHRGKSKEDAGFIKKETLDLLADFYTPFNMRLAELLDDDQWLFPRDASQDAAVDLTPAFPLSPFGPGVSLASEGSVVVAMEQQVGNSNPPSVAAAAPAAEPSQPQTQAETESKTQDAAPNAGETEVAADDTAVNNEQEEGEGGPEEGPGDGEGMEETEGETGEAGGTGDV